MGITYEGTKIHWNYFLAIEQDFEKLSRYIEFCDANNDTFSIELARIIMSASQDVDVILKNICKLLVGKEPSNIDGYRQVIKQYLPDLINEKAFISRFEMHSTPFLNWNDNKNPDWWRANTDIKHHRTTNFEKANLKNAINAVGALLIVNIYFYKLDVQLKNEDVVTDWKRLISTLGLKSSFIKLNENYYPNFVYV